MSQRGLPNQRKKVFSICETKKKKQATHFFPPHGAAVPRAFFNTAGAVGVFLSAGVGADFVLAPPACAVVPDWVAVLFFVAVSVFRAAISPFFAVTISAFFIAAISVFFAAVSPFFAVAVSAFFVVVISGLFVTVIPLFAMGIAAVVVLEARWGRPVSLECISATIVVMVRRNG
jgi:hypothetical protein